MPWNTDSPLGNISVRANRAPMNQNTKYIEFTMGNQAIGSQQTPGNRVNDHFWNLGDNLSGRHRFIQSPAFESPVDTIADPGIGPGMDGVIFLREVHGTVQIFYKNTGTVWQVSPIVLRGTTGPIGNNFVDVANVPANTYGEIFMYVPLSNGVFETQTGFYRSGLNIVNSYSILYLTGNGDSADSGLRFANGANSVVGDLVIRARRNDYTITGAWNYIVTYRSL